MAVHRIFGAVSILCILIATGAWAPGARSTAAQSFTVAPSPPWVDSVDAPDADGNATDARDGVLDLLEDSQTRVTANSVERYARHVSKALTAAGLERVSQIQIEFDPSEESLVIHFIRIRRDAATVEALRPADVKVIQPETDLSDRIYSGALSAVAFLPDVRPGDVVDYAYSLVSRTEGFDGRFVDTLVLGESYPVRRVRWRLLWPDGRKLCYRTQNADVEPRITPVPGGTEYVWQRERAPAVDVDDDAPAWFDPTPLVQASEFATWGDVVEWALPFYGTPDRLAPDLAKQVDAWKTAHEQPRDRLTAAVQFVQDEVRYTGIELGPSSYVPSNPETVFRRRFGDCKDKSLLLVTMLRAMGIEADPALASLDSGRVLPGWQPSPLAFDHCIVRARVDEKTYWIDPTITLQRGDLAGRWNPDYGYALVLRAGVADLEAIGTERGDDTTTAIAEVYTIEGDGARLESVSDYSGQDADDVRYTLAQSSLDDFGRDGLDYYTGDFASIEADGLPEVQDDQQANHIRIVERYHIASFWDDGERTLTADRVGDVLTSARASRRTGPLAIDFPVDVAERIEIRTDRPIDVAGESGTLSDEAVGFTYKCSTEGDATAFEFRYRTLADNVAANHVAQHRETIKKIRKRLDVTLRRRTGAARSLGVAALFGVPIAGIAAIAAAIALVWRRRSRQAASPALDPIELAEGRGTAE
jgi:transglutaminase-like putative cysteine protease